MKPIQRLRREIAGNRHQVNFGEIKDVHCAKISDSGERWSNRNPCERAGTIGSGCGEFGPRSVRADGAAVRDDAGQDLDASAVGRRTKTVGAG